MRLDDKYKFLENFEQNLEFFDKDSLEKLKFYPFLEKLLLKLEHSEITAFFYKTLFNFGRNVLCVPPGGAYDLYRTYIAYIANIAYIEGSVTVV